jgi:hypothetical protein
MQVFSCALSLILVVAAGNAWAQKDGPRTDALQDGFLGPIKTVATVITRSPVKWEQPDGPTMVMPVWCQECAYDEDGTRTTSGQFQDGKFLGKFMTLRRDASGRVIDRVSTDVATGQIEHHEVLGPYGRTEETDFDPKGKIQAVQTFTYDQYGHLHDWLSVDGEGRQLSHTLHRTQKDGTLIEESAWDKTDELTWQQTYDSDRDLEHFSTFDESGAVKLTWIIEHGKVLSFWEAPGQPHDRSQFGEGFIEDKGQGNVDDFRCHEGGVCDRSRVHYEYLDPAKKRNPTSAEWRNSDGKLLFASYVEYDLDSHGNWTHRNVSVWPSEQGSRANYEEDSRILTYWDK